MTARRRALRPTFDRLDGRILLSASPITPAQIRQAYSENYTFNVNGRSYTANGAGQTIAIVIGGLDPYISNDLATFDRTYGISAPPSFQSVSFQGAQYNESADAMLETSLDVEWTHAVAPGANILLVQAASMNNTDLLTAVNWARYQPGVSVVSMSWGGPESSADRQYDGIFTTPAGHTGVTFVASSGDSGFFNSPRSNQVGVEWPASSPNVLSVGGTTLAVTASGAFAGESAWNLSYQPSYGWSGGGGGYSRVYGEPSYQLGVQRTGLRTVPDVSYDAGSYISIYDSDPNLRGLGMNPGWNMVGGTSAGAPQWAAQIAEVDQGRALVGLRPLDGASQTLPGIYAFSSAFRDITTGSNGYSATPGYDLATGLGTPVAYVLASDLAFHVTSNFVATNTLDTFHSPGLTAGGLSSIGIGVLVDMAAPSSEGCPFGRSTAVADGVGTAMRDSLLITLPPTAPTSLRVSMGHRHDRHDLALGSLLDEELAFPMS
jgi:subtilase family serine protease